MGEKRSVLSIVFIFLVIGAALSTIFLQLMDYERLMNDWKAYWIWVAEWIAADILLTAFICRQDIRSLVGRGRKASDAPPAESAQSN